MVGYRDRMEYDEMDDDAKDSSPERVDGLVESLASELVEKTAKLASAMTTQSLYIQERHKLVRFRS